MILWILIGVMVVSLTGAVLLIKLGDDSYSDGVSAVSWMGGGLLIAIAIIMLCLIPLYAYNYESAKHQANIINREYGTNYSTEEVLHAIKVIDTVKHLNRTRVELNGDLLRNAVDK
jgi:uncharacterized membrane protein